MKEYKLLVKRAQEVVRITDDPTNSFVLAEQMRNVHVLRKKADFDDGFSILVGKDGKIVSIDSDENLAVKESLCDVVVDADGMVVVPGLVDAHNHPIWDGDRVHEFAVKLGGTSYMDVHKAGGGINYTVECTRKVPESELLKFLLDRLKWMLRCGTTLLEAKSGYGLSAESEVKLLRVLNKAAQTQPIEMSITFCGAHAVPKEMNSDQAVEDVINVQLPAVKQAIEIESLKVHNIDVFCENGVFSVEQSRRILQAGQSMGLHANFHGDELSATNSAELAAQLKAKAVSHLEHVTEQGMKQLAKSGTAAVILPTTAFMMRLKPPPVRQLINYGVIVALGSDFNPNAYCYSMPIVMYLACVMLKMTLEEALVASTINAAASLGLGSSHGAILPGRHADLLIIDAPKWEHLIYQFGCHEKLIRYVIKNGEIVYDRDSSTSL